MGETVEKGRSFIGKQHALFEFLIFMVPLSLVVVNQGRSGSDSAIGHRNNYDIFGI